MATSDIVVSNLAASPTLRGNVLTWDVADSFSDAFTKSYSYDAAEIFASTTNDRATAAKVGEGRITFTHGGLVEEATWYYWVRARNKNGSYGDWYPAGANSGISCRALGVAAAAFVLQNGSIAMSYVANSLVVSIRTPSGGNPSPSEPVYIAFRTIGSGGYQVRAIIAPLSITISPGSTLGTLDNTTFRLWLVAFDDAGTVRLALSNRYNPSTKQISPIYENVGNDAVAEGGAGAADSAGIYYASQTITTKIARALGFLTWEGGITTAGQWAGSAPAIELVSTRTKLPGEVVQEQITYNATYNSAASSAIPYDDTIPQSGEGNAALLPQMSLAAVTSGANVLEISANVNCSFNAATTMTVALFNAGDTAALAVQWADCRAADTPLKIELFHRMRALIASSAIFNLNIGGSAAGTTYINGTSAGRKFGGTLTSRYEIRELMG